MEDQPPEEKKSGAVFDRRSVVFGPGDIPALDELVRVGVFQKWDAPNRSTVIRALIRIAAEAYAGGVYPVTEPWALRLHEQLPIHLEQIKAGAAKRGPKS